ncbi:MAG: AAA family ATPase [Pseudomonadota bacterium]
MEDGLTRWGYSIPDGVEPSAIPVILVSGPPAAGKSTYIAQNAEAGDIVIDFDIYRQRVGGKKWDTDNKVWREAFKLRDADIRSLAHRSSGKCFLIVTAPTKDERDKWCEALGDVRVHVIATPEDECIARIKADPNRHEASSSQIEAVKHWWRYN